MRGSCLLCLNASDSNDTPTHLHTQHSSNLLVVLPVVGHCCMDTPGVSAEEDDDSRQLHKFDHKERGREGEREGGTCSVRTSTMTLKYAHT